MLFLIISKIFRFCKFSIDNISDFGYIEFIRIKITWKMILKQGTRQTKK